MSDSEYDIFINMVMSLSDHPANKAPFGTVYMRTLKTMRPALAKRIKGTLHDPTGRDKVHYLTEDFVVRNWDTISG